MVGNRAYCAYLNLIKYKLFFGLQNSKYIKKLIGSVVTYSSEAWALISVTINALKYLEGKIIRKIYGPVFERRE